MAKRDIELIVALAEGRLEDESEARALIERSPRLRAVYQAQTRAIEAMATLPPVEMTDTERAALHRGLWTSLTLKPASLPARRGVGLPRFGYATGAAVLVIGLIAALGQIGTSGDDGAATLDRIDTAGESLGGIPPSVTTAPAAEPLLGGDIAELFSDYAGMARSGSLDYSLAEDTATPTTRESSCLEEAGLADHTILGDIEEAGRRYLVAAPEDTTLGPSTPIAFVDLETCQIVFLDD